MDLVAEGLYIGYGDVQVVQDVSCEVLKGTSLVLLGPSGCGKTTLMRALAGLETPAKGRISLGERVLFDSSTRINVSANKRNMGMVFQSYAVWPHKTVFENVVFPLKMKRLPAGERRERVHEVLDLLGLSQFAKRSASMLSGGQMQRVALARSLVMRPDILLLDEPLSNLDALLRERLRAELREIQQELGLTCIYVTHDQTEAMALADTIIVMQQGRVAQRGVPQKIYDYPASADIARFMGVNNVVDVGVLENLHDSISRFVGEKAPGGTEAYLCFRAEEVTLHAAQHGPSETLTFAGRVAGASFAGAYVRYRVNVAEGQDVIAVVPAKDPGVFSVGQAVYVRVSETAVRVLPPAADVVAVA